jgi:hypothetical protein
MKAPVEPNSSISTWLPGCFSAQSFSLRLKIENHAFVMPSAMQPGAQLRPDALVEHERRMQWAAGTLTIGGAMALAF